MLFTSPSRDVETKQPLRAARTGRRVHAGKRAPDMEQTEKFESNKIL